MARSAKLSLIISTALAFGCAGLATTPSKAEPLPYAANGYHYRSSAIDRYLRDDYRREAPRAGLPAHLQRRTVRYRTSHAPGTIIVDTPNTYLYLVLGRGQAIRYGIGVGRTGFTWSGTQRVTRMTKWPDWRPPPEMLGRQPYLPRFMAGGPGNPMGARALYLGSTIYRIHGTNEPSTIGQRVSSGCIRMTNGDVIDLYNRTKLGAKVVVLPMSKRRTASAPALRGTN